MAGQLKAIVYSRGRRKRGSVKPPPQVLDGYVSPIVASPRNVRSIA